MTFLAGHVQDFQTTDDERQTRLLTRELRVSQGYSSGNSTKKKIKNSEIIFSYFNPWEIIPSDECDF